MLVRELYRALRPVSVAMTSLLSRQFLCYQSINRSKGHASALTDSLGCVRRGWLLRTAQYNWYEIARLSKYRNKIVEFFAESFAKSIQIHPS
jgi:hypothetical protein